MGQLAIVRKCDGLRCLAKDRQKCVAAWVTGAQFYRTRFEVSEAKSRPSCLPSEETSHYWGSKHSERDSLIISGIIIFRNGLESFLCFGVLYVLNVKCVSCQTFRELSKVLALKSLLGHKRDKIKIQTQKTL